MTPDEQAVKRLREALAEAGVPAPEDASFLELSVRASRLIREHAAYLRSSATRHKRVLLSGDLDDPWGTGRPIVIYNQDTDQWEGRSHLRTITSREIRDDGTQRLEWGFGNYALRQPGAAYAQLGKERRFMIPDTPDREAVRASIPAPVFRGKEQVFSFSVEGLKFNSSGHAYLLARSWQEVVHLAARQGVNLNAAYLTEYGYRDVGGDGEVAARANPGTIMVEARDATGVRGSYVTITEWMGYVQQARQQREQEYQTRKAEQLKKNQGGQS